MTDQAAAVAAAHQHRQANEAAILAEFVELLSLPNVSRNLEDIRRNAEHVQEMLEGRGVAARVVKREGAGPVVVGHLDSPGATQTIGFYVHYDGQPIDQPEWSVEPFKPTLLTAPLRDGGVERPLPLADEEVDPEWRLYARSASDDKAPILAIVTALDALAAAGVAPSANLVFLFEGEEEIGSPHLADFLEDLKDELAADVWLICDGPVHQTRRPQIVFGVRGISELEITVYGPNRPLHSGHYGNWAPNPNMALAQLLASMKDADGNVVITGFYEGTAPVTAADEAAVAALPDDDDALRTELGLGATEDNGAPHALRMLIPSLNVRGLQGGGVGDEAANVVPAEATASIDIRLAPGNGPEEMLDRVEAHIESRGWHIVRREPDVATRLEHPKVAKVTRESSYPGGRMRVDGDLAQALLSAAETAAGEPVVAMPTLGGSVPIHHFTTILGAPVAITPFANHDNNQHAANENIRVANLWYGIDLMAALMTMSLPVANSDWPLAISCTLWSTTSIPAASTFSGEEESMALLDYDRVVINQKAKLIELTNEYKIRDEEGNDIGMIRQEGQSKLKKVARFVSSLDQFMTHKLAVYDADGSKVLELVRPAKFVKSRVEVYDGDGQKAGTIVQKNVFGKIRFGLLDAAGGDLGEIQAENWRAWNFAIVDAAGSEVGRITKSWEGLAKTMFTTADDYLLDIQPGLSGPLRLLTFASAAGVDTALKQDSRGLS